MATASYCYYYYYCYCMLRTSIPIIRRCLPVWTGSRRAEAQRESLKQRAGYWLGVQDALRGSWDLVSKVLSTLSAVISNYKYSYLTLNPKP